MSLKKYSWLPKLAENVIEKNNIFAIKGENTFLFHSVRTNKQCTPYPKNHIFLTGVQEQTLFSEEPFSCIIKRKMDNKLFFF